MAVLAIQLADKVVSSTLPKGASRGTLIWIGRLNWDPGERVAVTGKVALAHPRELAKSNATVPVIGPILCSEWVKVTVCPGTTIVK